jgi:hypothetical protein
VHSYIVAGALMQQDEEGFLSLAEEADSVQGAENVMAFGKVRQRGGGRSACPACTGGRLASVAIGKGRQGMTLSREGLWKVEGIRGAGSAPLDRNGQAEKMQADSCAKHPCSHAQPSIARY